MANYHALYNFYGLAGALNAQRSTVGSLTNRINLAKSIHMTSLLEPAKPLLSGSIYSRLHGLTTFQHCLVTLRGLARENC